MTKPEEGEGLVIPEKQLSPAERIRKAKDAIETGRNLGIALEMVGKLEALTQFAERDPDESSEILGQFERFENVIQNVSGGRFQKEDLNKFIEDFTPWLDRAFERMEEKKGKTGEK